MITGELKSKVDNIWNTMWSGGISNPLSVIEQLTYLLFIKRLDELHTLKERKAARAGTPIQEPVFAADQDRLRWSRFKDAAPEVVRDELAHGRPEERVAVMDEKPDVSQASVLGIGGVPHELGDPRPVGLGADARDLTAAAGQVHQAQHGDAGQAAWRPDRDREEVGGGEHVPVGRETLPPGRARRAFGGGF